MEIPFETFLVPTSLLDKPKTKTEWIHLGYTVQLKTYERDSAEIVATNWRCYSCGREVSVKECSLIPPDFECPRCGGKLIDQYYQIYKNKIGGAND